ncbi:hypothetical protein SALBM311S_00241 [Streptomyces alboniger]
MSGHRPVIPVKSRSGLSLVPLAVPVWACFDPPRGASRREICPFRESGELCRSEWPTEAQKKHTRREPHVMNPAFQVEAAEISDADLDNVSGGLGLGGSGGLCLETPLGDIAGGLAAVASPEGLSAGVHTTAL